MQGLCPDVEVQCLHGQEMTVATWHHVRHLSRRLAHLSACELTCCEALSWKGNSGKRTPLTTAMCIPGPAHVRHMQPSSPVMA